VDVGEEGPRALVLQPRRHCLSSFAGVAAALVSPADDPGKLADHSLVGERHRGLHAADRQTAVSCLLLCQAEFRARSAQRQRR
jgi:hypothetical protein